MKKYVVLLALLAVLGMLFSCGHREEKRFFDYQDELKSAEGVLTFGETEYGVALYFEKQEGEGICRRIEYSAPESLSGLSFTLEGDKITAELSGIRIAYSYFESEEVFRLSRLFCLCEEDIYRIDGEKDGSVRAYGKNESVLWQVVTDKEGMPSEIVYEDGNGVCSFKVGELAFFEASKNRES
ncbi:MAG: hypothetical protein E7647_07930 [Ruminococcaceae bacterium]|nr:hypothetical protein [Oscillospiraceae bacterium]